ncbi:hypothetical protein LINGRAHAP2_LOCUS2011 [Linum grandiflorum]
MAYWGLTIDLSCLLCDDGVDEIEHILLTCPLVTALGGGGGLSLLVHGVLKLLAQFGGSSEFAMEVGSFGEPSLIICGMRGALVLLKVTVFLRIYLLDGFNLMFVFFALSSIALVSSSS